MNIEKLNWDTDFFGVLCGKTILKAEASENEWIEGIEGFVKYDFVSIQNMHNNIKNNKMIAKYTDAFLVDVNVQFEKKIINSDKTIIENVYIEAAETLKSRKEECFRIMDHAFEYSKFICDEELLRRNGEMVYKKWIESAMDSGVKSLVISEKDNELKGYILFSIEKDNAIIELIIVDKQVRGEHLGKQMILALENYLLEQNVQKLQVGTQINNIGAINFYLSNGFFQKDCVSVYHYWRQR